jgi:lauroyl/myristoyl acyltransferase
MNRLARQAQDLYYHFFSGLIGLLGGVKTPGYSYKLAHYLGVIRTRIGYIGSGWSRERYLHTVNLIFPGIEKKSASDLVSAYWINHQKKFIELFLARGLKSENIEHLVTFENLTYLDEALKRGRGVILPVPHIGNERLHHIALALKGYPMAVISSRYEDHGAFARHVKLDASARFHDVGHPGDLKWLLKTLKQNKVLQVASDAEADANGVRVTFLGQNLILPTGWVRLAQSADAAIFPSALLRHSDNHSILTIKPEFILTKTGNRDNDLQTNVQRYMDVIAEFFKQRPDQIDWMSLSVRLDESVGHPI